MIEFQKGLENEMVPGSPGGEGGGRGDYWILEGCISQVTLVKECGSFSYESEVSVFLPFYKLLLDATGRSPETLPSTEAYI